ncbi:MAG TPA: M18 family aminopeptidase, partial [Clostridiales bacterium]|nr:M18 family aminopeptidase [Clostridiales bacterium]
EERLVNLDRDLLTIPSVAIHMNRAVNEGYKWNPAVDLLPLYGTADAAGGFAAELADAAGAPAADILSHDLFLYNREYGRRFGKDGTLLLAPRLDDLGCVFASMEGFLAAEESREIPVLALFDNEEVGSETKQGAASTFLHDTLRRIAKHDLSAMLYQSFLVSADNAHAKHPNHPELADADNAPTLGGGVVIKYNANQHYTTDAYSDAFFRTVCERAGVPTQRYCNRADIRGGSTLGSISDTRVSVPTVDIGLPQLAMHAAAETAASADLDAMILALTAFYSSSFTREGQKTVFNR